MDRFGRHYVPVANQGFATPRTFIATREFIATPRTIVCTQFVLLQYNQLFPGNNVDLKSTRSDVQNRSDTYIRK